MRWLLAGFGISLQVLVRRVRSQSTPAAVLILHFDCDQAFNCTYVYVQLSGHRPHLVPGIFCSPEKKSVRPIQFYPDIVDMNGRVHNPAASASLYPVSCMLYLARQIERGNTLAGTHFSSYPVRAR